MISSLAIKNSVFRKRLRVNIKSQSRTWRLLRARGSLGCVSMARSHPYGDGGIQNQADWSDYDPEAFAKEVAEAERLLNTETKAEEISKWTIIMNADIIQNNNNLFETSQERGFKWDLHGLSVLQLAERTAVREIENHLATVWTVHVASEGEIHFSFNDRRGLLCFARWDEAHRFADQLSASLGIDAVAKEQITKVIRAECDREDKLIGFVPSETLVTPAMLGIS